MTPTPSAAPTHPLRIVAVLVAGLVLIALFAWNAAPPAKLPRIGFLTPASVATHGALYEAFKQGLREHGYIEGQTIALEERWVGGRLDLLPAAAAELVRLKPDVIVVAGSNATQAAKEATATIPIVMATVNDPVGLGFVASLARPGGNITGLSSQGEDVAQKFAEILLAMVPHAGQIGVLGNPDSPAHAGPWRETQAAAKALGVQVVLAPARRPQEIPGAFVDMMKGNPQALIVLPDAMLLTHHQAVADLAASYRLPAIYPFREFVEVGGLMSYGVHLRDNYRRVATYVDKILKGAHPAKLPIEQPTQFELVINMKTAKALGLTIPPSVLLRADEVIQ